MNKKQIIDLTHKQLMIKFGTFIAPNVITSINNNVRTFYCLNDHMEKAICSITFPKNIDINNASGKVIFTSYEMPWEHDEAIDIDKINQTIDLFSDRIISSINKFI